MQNKVLIIPSWYATPEAPTSGSFFKEQAELMMDDFDVKVLVSKKRWISWKRYFFEKFVKNYPKKFQPFFLDSPSTLYFEYDFVKIFSEEKNFEIMIANYLEMIHYLIKKINWYPKLIHAHSSFLGGIIAQRISEEFNIPYIITEHLGPFSLERYSEMWRKVIVKSLEKANRVLAVSEHQKQHILMSKINCKPISVGNFVNDQLFKIKENNTETFTVVFIAYYPNYIKDIDTLFQTIVLLKKARIHFILIGGGELSGEFEENYYFKRTIELGVQNIVKVIPSANRVEMKQIIETSSILISTSIAESFGIVLCEAMLCGKPVVTTNNGGCADFMLDGVNGYTVPIRNPKALAERIIYVKENYSNFSPETIRNSIVSKYGTLAFKERISEIYFDTINNA